MLKRCHLLCYPCPCPGDPCPIHYYWDEHGDLCIETWESDRARIFGYIKNEIVGKGLCGEDGKIIKDKEVSE